MAWKPIFVYTNSEPPPPALLANSGGSAVTLLVTVLLELVGFNPRHRLQFAGATVTALALIYLVFTFVRRR